MLFDKNSIRQPKLANDAILYIAGKKITQGTVETITKLYLQEAGHKRASVEMKVRMEDGSYKTKYKFFRPDAVS